MSKKQIGANSNCCYKAISNNFNNRAVDCAYAINCYTDAYRQKKNACGKCGDVFPDDNGLPNMNHQMQREGNERA